MINGSATKELPITKGVQQGDPLPSFLLMIAMEGLNAAKKSVCELSLFQGVNIPREALVISRLFCVDDALFVGDWNYSKFENLTRVLRCFHP